MKINKFKIDEYVINTWILPILVLMLFFHVIMLIVIVYNHEFLWGILASIVGVFITVIWINIILPSQDKKRWNIVKGSVYEEFGYIALNLFSLIRMHIKEGILSVSGETPTSETWNRVELEKLENLAKTQKVELNRTGEKLFDGDSEAFSRYLADLNNFEIKYARFIEPEEQSILIRLQKTIRHIIFLIDATKLPEEIKMPKEKFKEIIPKHFAKVIVLINELRKEGIEFFV